MPKESKRNTAAQYAVTGLTGGVGRVVEKAAHRSISRVAEKSAVGYKNRQRRKRVGSIPKPAKKMHTAGFAVMVGLAITKDILDIILALTFFLSLLTSIFGIVVSFITVFYFVYNDVKWTSRKIVTILITSIVEFIPFVNVIFPAATINLFLVRKFENNDRLKAFAKKKASLLSKA